MPASNPPHLQCLKIRDLRGYLAKQQISPEKLAEDVQLSHMTIRRWLKKKDDALIPQKYYSLLSPVFARPGVSHADRPSPFPAAFDMDSLMGEIEKSGKEYQENQDVQKLEKDLSVKLKTARVDKIFFDYSKRLITAIRSPKTTLKKKAIAAGALIYFISPIDLIPDHIPVVGYLDDLAVMSLAVNAIASDDAESPTEKRLLKI